MAIAHERVHRMNNEGTYNTVHYETDSDMVIMGDDNTLETKFNSLVNSTDNHFTEIDNNITALRAAVGSPLVASAISDMTDTNKIYVYTGTTTTVSNVTFTAGNWYYYDGTKWQLGGTYNETALETDITLALEGRAADAKAVGDAISDMGYVDDIILRNTDANVSSSNYSVYIVASNVWGSGTNRSCGIHPIPENTVKIEVVANESEATGIALLTTNAHATQTPPDYASGWDKVLYIQPGGSTRINVTEDAKYIYYTKAFNSISHIPSRLTWMKPIIPELDTRINTNSSGIQNLDTKIDDLLGDAESIDPSRSRYNCFITSSNVWSTGGQRYCGMMPIPEGVVRVEVKAGSTNNAAVAMLTTNSHAGSTTPDFAEGWTGIVVVTLGETSKFDVPQGAKYLYYIKQSNDNIYTPESIKYFSYIDIKEKFNNSLGLHEDPPSQTALNIIRRCRQYTDIEWTPATDLPRYMGANGLNPPSTAVSDHWRGVFRAGKTYKGIPYGRTAGVMSDYGYDYTSVGNYVSFETFVSSVSNPDSKVCKEDIGTVAGHKSIYYASVCSGMTCYALNVPEVPTASIGNIPGLNFIGLLNNNGTLLGDELIKLGDTLNKYNSHTGTITDIIRDSDGLIQYVEISHNTSGGEVNNNHRDGLDGGIACRKGYTRDSFFDPSGWGGYSLYRYTGNVPYVPSPYVNVGDEFNMFRVTYFPCMPYEGNRFVYKSGYIPNNAIKILVSVSGFSFLKVFKNGVEISGSPFTISADTISVDVPEISVGEYSAYLCNIEDGNVVRMTYQCEWSIQ